MKFVTFLNQLGQMRAGFIKNDWIIDLQKASKGQLPEHMLDVLLNQEALLPLAKQLYQEFDEQNATWLEKGMAVPLKGASLHPPLPNPPSFRDFYAFEEHVKTARQKRGLSVIPEWYDFPVFYFSNHQAVLGPNESVPRPQKCKWLDYELEMACVIGKKGKNIKANEAESYIFGYMILNDWSARDIQREEMKVGLGPAKGKDFATSMGPYLVTRDELEPYRVGDRLDLQMTAKVNGKLLSNGNFKDIYYTFGQMIERASEDAALYPGDVIGSGTVGTGCILELGTEVHRWLEPGDEVELEITGLGTLRNKISD